MTKKEIKKEDLTLEFVRANTKKDENGKFKVESDVMEAILNNNSYIRENYKNCKEKNERYEEKFLENFAKRVIDEYEANKAQWEYKGKLSIVKKYKTNKDDPFKIIDSENPNKSYYPFIIFARIGEIRTTLDDVYTFIKNGKHLYDGSEESIEMIKALTDDYDILKYLKEGRNKKETEKIMKSFELRIIKIQNLNENDWDETLTFGSNKYITTPHGKEQVQNYFKRKEFIQTREIRTTLDDVYTFIKNGKHLYDGSEESMEMIKALTDDYDILKYLKKGRNKKEAEKIIKKFELRIIEIQNLNENDWDEKGAFTFGSRKNITTPHGKKHVAEYFGKERIKITLEEVYNSIKKNNGKLPDYMKELIQLNYAGFDFLEDPIHLEYFSETILSLPKQYKDWNKKKKKSITSHDEIIKYNGESYEIQNVTKRGRPSHKSTVKIPIKDVFESIIYNPDNSKTLPEKMKNELLEKYGNKVKAIFDSEDGVRIFSERVLNFYDEHQNKGDWDKIKYRGMTDKNSYGYFFNTKSLSPSIDDIVNELHNNNHTLSEDTIKKILKDVQGKTNENLVTACLRYPYRINTFCSRVLKAYEKHMKNGDWETYKKNKITSIVNQKFYNKNRVTIAYVIKETKNKRKVPKELLEEIFDDYSSLNEDNIIDINEKIKMFSEYYENNEITGKYADLNCNFSQKFDFFGIKKMTLIEYLKSPYIYKEEFQIRYAGERFINGLLQNKIREKKDGVFGKKINSVHDDAIKSIFNKDRHPAIQIFENMETRRFDFYVNEQLLIEYDGEQHFKPTTWEKAKNKQERAELREKEFERNKESDFYKNLMAYGNKLPILRIPYIYDPEDPEGQKKIDEFVDYYIATGCVPEEIIQFYEDIANGKNPEINPRMYEYGKHDYNVDLMYVEHAKDMNKRYRLNNGEKYIEYIQNCLERQDAEINEYINNFEKAIESENPEEQIKILKEHQSEILDHLDQILPKTYLVLLELAQDNSNNALSLKELSNAMEELHVNAMRKIHGEEFEKSSPDPDARGGFKELLEPFKDKNKYIEEGFYIYAPENVDDAFDRNSKRIDPFDIQKNEEPIK